MISLVTLAHRVSSIHKRYAAIHSSVFSFSISQLKINFWRRKKTEYCDYEAALVQMCRELAEIRAIIDREETLEQANTINREFAFALDVYIIALSDAITWLSTICGRRCRDHKGEETYSAKQDWADRHDYDDAIQQYRYLGKRLESLFNRL